MRGDYRLTTFASGCGDSILIEAHDKVVMVDIHYRAARPQDDEDDEAPDSRKIFARPAATTISTCSYPPIPTRVMSAASAKSSIAGRLRPGTAILKIPIPRYPKIIVDEIWCSPYGLNPHYTTDQSKPLTDEIKRRHNGRSRRSGDGARRYCRSCEKVVQAPTPVKAIARGKATFGTLAHVVVSKFHHHLPLYRQAEIMAAQGIEIDRSTLAGWVGQASVLLDPIISRIREVGLPMAASVGSR